VNEIRQTNGVLQGDPLSPLLFNIATSDAIKAIESDSRRTKIYAYADDMVMVSTSIRELQESFDDLADWAKDNSLQMNVGKTEMMVFRKGGKVRHEDKIAYGRDYLKVVNSYKYLGITLQPSGTAFTMHIVICSQVLYSRWKFITLQSSIHNC
jgi:hypothetical protein